MKKLRVFVSMVLLASMISLTACGSKAATENKNTAKETSTVETAKNSEKTEEKKASYPLTIKDDLKNEVVLKEKPKKIAAISNTYLDILYAAGGKSIARTDSRNPNLPKEIKDLESVGAVYNVDVEKLISLKPDLVISQFGLQNKIVPILQKSNIPVISLNMKSYDDVVEKLKLMGQITENEDKVEKIINDMNSKKEELTKKLPEKPKKVAILYVNGKGVLTKLDNSLAGNVAKELKLDNMSSGLKPEKMGSENAPFSMEKIVESNPDVILVTTMVSSREKAEQCIKKNLESNPAWKELKAVKENKMVFLPQSHFLSNPGDKYVESIEFMARAVYPEVYGNVEEMGIK
ncbi:ABC transporter substrate-binding protein [Hathewaya limosa]|uniref:Iron complex transport system substrate-binding protein n=1 Tax=Hathewaya limosa TaxID=1536 RepID=A0ABU0JTT4_HATLI|nr:ABC transporter substrate-binding protein [Hathewaya limosa]MDQ0480517.1 iron complex transport system substrate-binding protein [Hathewaya limosa]